MHQCPLKLMISPTKRPIPSPVRVIPLLSFTASFFVIARLAPLEEFFAPSG